MADLQAIKAAGRAAGVSETGVPAYRASCPYDGRTREGRAWWRGFTEWFKALDALCALWIDEAPRFGAMAAHFPKSLRARAFVASFWHPAVFFSSPDGRESWYRDLPCSPRTRAQLDCRCSWLLGLLRPTGYEQPFWSPELPEVIILEEEGIRAFCVKRSESGGSFPWWPLVYAFPPIARQEDAHLLPPGVPGSGVSQLVGAFSRRGGRR